MTSSKSTQLLNIYRHFSTLNNLTQHNNILNHNGKILDVLLTTDHFNIDICKHSVPLVPEDPHHPCLEMIISCVNEQCNTRFPRNSESLKFNFRRANFMELYLTLSLIDWSRILEITDVDSACKETYIIIYDLLHKYVPLQRTTTKRKNYPMWFTKSVIDVVNLKNKHWKCYKKTKFLYHLDKGIS